MKQPLTDLPAIRDRIKEFRRVKASDIKPSPHNWKNHPKAQVEALRGTLAQLGFAGAILTRELPDGGLEAIDGHMRIDTMGDSEVPVLVTDLDEAEAKLALATYDPLATLAETNSKQLGDLLGAVTPNSEAVNTMLKHMAEENGLGGEAKLKPLPIDLAPPKMAWVMIAIPTVSFGLISDAIESIAKLPGVMVSTTANDGPKELRGGA